MVSRRSLNAKRKETVYAMESGGRRQHGRPRKNTSRVTEMKRWNGLEGDTCGTIGMVDGGWASEDVE